MVRNLGPVSSGGGGGGGRGGVRGICTVLAARETGKERWLRKLRARWVKMVFSRQTIDGETVFCIFSLLTRIFCCACVSQFKNYACSRLTNT